MPDEVKVETVMGLVIIVLMLAIITISWSVGESVAASACDEFGYDNGSYNWASHEVVCRYDPLRVSLEEIRAYYEGQ